jgi:hypothetical protein
MPSRPRPKRIHAPLVLILPVAAALIVSSCGTLKFLEPPPRAPVRATGDPGVVSLRAKLVEGANSLLGKKDLEVRGKSFTYDCSGTVLAIYWYAGIDLAREYSRYAGNGVTRIFKSLERAGLLYDSAYPVSGDLIFWDNTYDANDDGLWNDTLTHIGMVVSTAEDGTVSYVHHHTRRGIVIEYMNLREPAVYQREVWGQMRTLNSPLRLAEAGRPHPTLWLSGQLYRILGMGYLY